MDYELYLLLIFVISSLNCLMSIGIVFCLINFYHQNSTVLAEPKTDNTDNAGFSSGKTLKKSGFILRDDEDLAVAEELNKKGRIPYG